MAAREDVSVRAKTHQQAQAIRLKAQAMLDDRNAQKRAAALTPLGNDPSAQNAERVKHGRWLNNEE